jgi:hypothetical protein
MPRALHHKHLLGSENVRGSLVQESFHCCVTRTAMLGPRASPEDACLAPHVDLGRRPRCAERRLSGLEKRVTVKLLLTILFIIAGMQRLAQEDWTRCLQESGKLQLDGTPSTCDKFG